MGFRISEFWFNCEAKDIRDGNDFEGQKEVYAENQDGDVLFEYLPDVDRVRIGFAWGWMEIPAQDFNKELVGFLQELERLAK